jgi:hypothetical protein
MRLPTSQSRTFDQSSMTSSKPDRQTGAPTSAKQ